MQAINILTKPLDKYLMQPDIMELTVVDSGKICLERDITGYEKIADNELTFEYWENLCHVLANSSGVAFDVVKQPRLSTILPGGHRIEAMLGNNVDSKISVSIRVKRNIQRQITDFGIDDDVATDLIAKLNSGCNFIISGGTSSGKTSFLNALLQHIDRSKRVLTAEDTREVNLPDTPYSSQYVVSRNEEKSIIRYPQIIDHFMRSRPDMVILGEISIDNAFPALRLLNTGHGFMCTIHANSPELAFDAFMHNMQMAGHETQNVLECLYKTVDIIVQLGAGRNNGKRIVTEIYNPKEKEVLWQKHQ